MFILEGMDDLLGFCIDDLILLIHIESGSNNGYSYGVTEAFIKNMLVRANAELGCRFDPDDFIYEARWREDAGRVEMHLRSLRPQQVRLGAERFALDAGERIHIENSHKYAPGAFATLAEDAGFAVRACFTDEAERFAVFVLGVG